MKYCKKCVMPDTRPGITFDSDGVCMPCKNHERKQKVDYEARFEEFKKLCDKYRGCNGDSWDCAIAVSGGKDSYMLVHVMREKMGMNPLLLFVDDNLSVTEAGKHNLLNLSEEFGCHLIRFNLDRRLNKLITRKTFEKYGKPMWLVEQLIGTYPVHMALRFNISLLVYAENMSYEYGGFGAKETYSAKNLLQDSAVGDIATQLIDDNIKKQDFGFILPPPQSELEKLDPIYLSYFIPWNSYSHYIFAKSRGLHDLRGEWDRTMSVESFDQVDSIGLHVHHWMKYPKFGHAYATDMTSRFIRYGMMSRDEAIELVKKHDHDLDLRVVEDFCKFTGYRESEFWKILDGFYNRDIFTKDSFGRWVLKNPVWES